MNIAVETSLNKSNNQSGSEIEIETKDIFDIYANKKKETRQKLIYYNAIQILNGR